MEEGEHRFTKELVFKLREMDDEVLVVDSLQGRWSGWRRSSLSWGAR